MPSATFVSDDGTLLTIIWSGHGSDLTVEGAYTPDGERDVFLTSSQQDRDEMYALAAYTDQQMLIDQADALR